MNAVLKDVEIPAVAAPAFSHLDGLESEAIHVMREVVAETTNPALLFSGQGLDRDAAPRREGLPPGSLSVPARAHRYRAQLRRGHRLPRRAHARAGRAARRAVRG